MIVMNACRQLTAFCLFMGLAFAQQTPTPCEDYVDSLVGFSFTKPAGWTLHARLPVNGGPGACVDMVESSSPEPIFLTICGKPDTTDAAGIDRALHTGLDNHILDSLNRLNRQIALRPGSLQSGSLSGRETLSAIFDFTLRDQPGADYIV